MSMICIGVTKCLNDDELNSIKSKLLRIAKEHNRNVWVEVGWSEPIIYSLPFSSFAFSLEDNASNNNCEMLLLPEGWCHNGKTNNVSVIERMMFIQEIAESILLAGFPIEFYIGTSGELPEDYETKVVAYQHLASFLAEHIEAINSTAAFRIIPGIQFD